MMQGTPINHKIQMSLCLTNKQKSVPMPPTNAMLNKNSEARRHPR
jgi:hypothetical protein